MIDKVIGGASYQNVDDATLRFVLDFRESIICKYDAIYVSGRASCDLMQHMLQGEHDTIMQYVLQGELEV